MIISALAVLSLGLAACGGGDGGGPSKSDQAKFEEAALKHAKCLREHGIDAPDPKPGGGFEVRGRPGDEGRLERAEKDCKHFLDDVPPPKASKQQQAEMADQALAHSRCIRAHGVPKFPDPQIDAEGRMTMKITPDIAPDNATLRRAEEACRSTQPQFKGSPGGGSAIGGGPKQ